MERALVHAADWWWAFLARIGCHDCGGVPVVASWLAGAAALTGTLAAVASDIADTAIVQTVAQLLARGLPF